MRRTSLKLSIAKVNGQKYYCITLPKLGRGRARRFFRERSEAETFLNARKSELQNYGAAAFALPERSRIDAAEAERLLAPFGKTIADATRFYVSHLTASSSSKIVSLTIADLLAEKRGDGLSSRYTSDLRNRLNRFAEKFGQRIIATITAGEIDIWLRSLPVGGVTRNTFRRRLSVLFTFAKSKKLVVANPTIEVSRAKELPGETGILSVQALTELLSVASVETLPFWALGAFAGLRRCEIERLEWSEIDLIDGCVTVTAQKSKTASRRLVSMEPNLREWLAPYQHYRGKVCPIDLQARLNLDRDKAGLRHDWPQNALRHSFGSYHLARYHDVAALALQMGNSPAMIFRHYRQLVRAKDAESYWKITPSSATLPRLTAGERSNVRSEAVV